MSAKLGLNIRLNSCGKGLHIVHLSSVITNGDIGENYIAFPNTLVGMKNCKYPIIGNNVTACTGSVIVGDIVIANNIKIGANSFVDKSFEEENCIIAGVPAKMVKKLSQTKNN